MRSGNESRSSSRQNGGTAGKQASGAAGTVGKATLRKLAAELPREERGKGNGEGPAGLDPRTLLGALTSLRRGDFSVRLPEGMTGVEGKIAEAFN
ncbi:MAG TPA: hypothetical protein VFL12_12890, partial [Thermoanaerobaculia bacterium]|nr:hypothetical protein [Thermoanaerobaculia bacterium]